MKEPTKIKHGSDDHLKLIDAAYGLHLLNGDDMSDVLAFGRACMSEEHSRWREAANVALAALCLDAEENEQLSRDAEAIRALLDLIHEPIVVGV